MLPEVQLIRMCLQHEWLADTPPEPPAKQAITVGEGMAISTAIASTNWCIFRITLADSPATTKELHGSGDLKVIHLTHRSAAATALSLLPA